jgi:D-arginine dehydrogenase
MANTADIIVIGAGMAGMGAAAHLGAGAKVVVLEMEDQPGFHSTGRSVATYIESYGSPVVRSLNKASVGFLRDADPEFWHQPLLSDLGLLYFALNGEARSLDDILAEGLGFAELTMDEAVGMMPILRPDRICRAVYDEGVKSIDVNEMLMGYRRLARKRGVEIVCGASAQKLVRTGASWEIDTPKGVYAAPVVVNAAGAWVDDIARRAGLAPLGFTPKRRSVATVSVPESHGGTAGWPLCAECKETFYFKPEAGTLLVSPADETPVEPHDAYADDMALAEGLDRFMNATTIEITRLGRTWAGLRTFSPDKSHVIGFDPRTEGFFWFGGQGGYGIQSAQGGALSVAGLIFERALPPSVTATGLTAEQVAPDRFLA